MAQIVCNDLSIGYNGKIVCSKLNFEIQKGDYLVVIGENGCGKSTLIKTILGIQKPLSGNVIISDDLKRTEIGYLSQQSEIQKDFPASVMEIVLSGCLARMGLKPFYGKAEKTLALEKIELMGLKGFERRSYSNLSGGQKQRVLLARALCATKNILFLDEPTTGLDPYISRDMYDLISKLNAGGITIVMVSHDINVAMLYANKILKIHSDNTFFGKKEDYIRYSGETNDSILRRV